MLLSQGRLARAKRLLVAFEVARRAATLALEARVEGGQVTVSEARGRAHFAAFAALPASSACEAETWST
jgi:hypothetical protein